jgi:uncharacterized protein with FMN-binding domain
MRRGVVVVMSGVTVLVAGVSMRDGQRSLLVGLRTAAAPAGVVGSSDTAATGQAGQPAGPSPTRAATGSVAKKPVAAASPSAVPTRRQSPAPVTSPRAVVAARPAPSPTPKPATTVTVNGAPADTQYGPVQVQISIRSGRIIRADAIDYPQGSRRDQEINSYAIPQLNQETLDAQSANIDTVSGATYTSDGYRQSLQSALDAAHRAGAR